MDLNPSMDTCQVCQKECKALRCVSCRQAIYCSVSCQKKDWKAGHRLICQSVGTKKEKADWALRQLVTLTHTVHLDDLKEHHDRASDEVKRRQNNRLTSRTEKSRQRSVQTTISNQQRDTTLTQQTRIPLHEKSPLNFDVVVEDMKFITRFQMTLRRRRNTIIDDVDLSKVQVNFTILDARRTRTNLKIMSDEGSILYSVTLPRLVEENSPRIRLLSQDTVQVSIRYKEDLTLRELGTRDVLICLEDLNQIQCSSCQTPLLSGKNSIKRTAELPVGHWDDIAETLICYNGQPFVDFSTTSITVEPSVALQDGNFLCLNYMDLSSTASVQPVSGYGEIEDGKDSPTTCSSGSTAQEDDGGRNSTSSMKLLLDPAATIRGERLWRDVTGGGATVCCNHCFKPIGFASLESPESFRLLKHRISVPRKKVISDDPSVRGPPPSLTQRLLSSCASFLAREMIRYAESKAIFTFIVTLEQPVMSFASTVFTRCILLRLVSWDCSIATTTSSCDGEEEEDSPLLSEEELYFRRYAKVVFEETYDKRGKGDGKWLWGGIDLCCPPLNMDQLNPNVEDDDKDERKTDEGLPGAQKVSSTRIQLSQEDYNSTLEDLRLGRNLFTKDVADATILMKMGKISNPTDHKGDDNSGLGLTAIPL